MTQPRTIAVCFPRPLFLPSTLERRAQDLVDVACSRGHEAVIVTIPCVSDDLRLEAEAGLKWALVDLSEIGTGRTIDAAICLHPVALFLHHPRKVAWLTGDGEDDVRVRRALRLTRANEVNPLVVASEAGPGEVVDAAVTAGASRMAIPR